MNSRVRGWLVPGGIITMPIANPWSSSGTKLPGTRMNRNAPTTSNATNATLQTSM
jgi:hypothetical protein